jgi:hypothetical protein
MRLLSVKLKGQYGEFEIKHANDFDDKRIDVIFSSTGTVVSEQVVRNTEIAARIIVDHVGPCTEEELLVVKELVSHLISESVSTKINTVLQ